MNSENSLYKVVPGLYRAEIDLPSSKSYANRALIIGAIRGGGFTVHHLSASTDVLAMLSCLEKLGLKLHRQGSSVSFLNSFPLCEEESEALTIDLHTGDGGTTNRFLLALLSRGKKTYRLFPSEKMSERPIEDLLKPLTDLGVRVETNKKGAWVEIQGPAIITKGQRLEVDCSKSTQFASAMMLAFSNTLLEILPVKVQASESYLGMTAHLLKETQQKMAVDVPVDFSSLSYPFVLALAGGEVLIKNCHALDPFQADAALIDIARAAGADVKWTNRGLLVRSQRALKPFCVDGSRFPDLVPALVFLASLIPGESILQNLSVLRYKESDRLEELTKILQACSIPFHFDEDRAEIKINGGSLPKTPLRLHTARDHRMVMTAFLFLKAGAGGELAEVDCVDKSFPDFFTLMNGVNR